MRTLPVPRRLIASILSHLDSGELLETTPAAFDAPWAVFAVQHGMTQVLFAGLRRGHELLGIQVACYRGRHMPLSVTQERIARGIAQMAVLALDNAQLLKQANEANRLKSDFLATISHELRTPLNIILGYIDLLLEGEFGPLTATQALPHRKVDKNARELLELIVATLDISRLEVGHLPVVVAMVNARELLDELQGELLLPLEKPNLRLYWQAVPDLLLIRTDRLKLKVILKNLLSNALKFTDKGEVRVAVEPCDDGIAFIVSDTGIGIEPENLPIIFEPFRQGEHASTRRYRGVGLGLYIVKRILEVLGGMVTVDSEVGKGSTFRVWIPKNGKG